MNDSTPTSRPVNNNEGISLVIPCWRDVDLLEKVLRPVTGHPALREIVIAEAEPAGAGKEIAERFAAIHVACPRPNRGEQMNRGAAVGTGEVILFHHADTQLDPAHLESLAQAAKGDWAGGAFCRKFDHRHPRLCFLERLDSWRSNYFGPIFGDQSLFVRREVFRKMGGFANIPLMEDVDFSTRLRRAGRLRMLHPPIATSARRSERDGAWLTTLRNAWYVTLYYFGAHPEAIHARYYRKTFRARESCPKQGVGANL